MQKKGTQTVERYTRLPLHTRASVALLPLALAGMGSAQTAPSGTELSDAAKTGMTGIAGAVLAILLVGIGIKVLFFSNRKVGQGISKS